MIGLDTLPTNPLDAYESAQKAALDARQALLERLGIIEEERKAIRQKLGRVRNPKAAKPGRKPKPAPIEK
jgi:hypothetical protein